MLTKNKENVHYFYHFEWERLCLFLALTVEIFIQGNKCHKFSRTSKISLSKCCNGKWRPKNAFYHTWTPNDTRFMASDPEKTCHNNIRHTTSVEATVLQTVCEFSCAFGILLSYARAQYIPAQIYSIYHNKKI